MKLYHTSSVCLFQCFRPSPCCLVLSRHYSSPGTEPYLSQHWPMHSRCAVNTLWKVQLNNFGLSQKSSSQRMSELKSVWCEQCNIKVTEGPQMAWAKLGRWALLSKVLSGALPLVGGALDTQHPLIYHLRARSSHQCPLLATTVVTLGLTAGSPVKPSIPSASAP